MSLTNGHANMIRRLAALPVPEVHNDSTADDYRALDAYMVAFAEIVDDQIWNVAREAANGCPGLDRLGCIHHYRECLMSPDHRNVLFSALDGFLLHYLQEIPNECFASDDEFEDA